MTRVTRQVERAYDSAKGRTVAHLDSAAMDSLAVDRGDTLAVDGDDRTVVIAEPQRTDDPAGEAIRLDGFTRDNPRNGCRHRDGRGDRGRRRDRPASEPAVLSDHR